MGEAARNFSNPVELQRRIGREITLSQVESIALECLKQIASEGRQATQPELCAATGVGYQQGTLPAILRRLEDKGYITRTFYQRGMQVHITSTGQSTAAPRCTAPHWRNRTDRVQSPAIHTVRQRDHSTASLIEMEARRSGKHMSDFLADLVYIGWHAYQAEKEQEA